MSKSIFLSSSILLFSSFCYLCIKDTLSLLLCQIKFCILFIYHFCTVFLQKYKAWQYVLNFILSCPALLTATPLRCVRGHLLSANILPILYFYCHHGFAAWTFRLNDSNRTTRVYIKKALSTMATNCHHIFFLLHGSSPSPLMFHKGCTDS